MESSHYEMIYVNLAFFKQYQKDLLWAFHTKDLAMAQTIVMNEEKRSLINFEELLFLLFSHRYKWRKDEIKPLADITELLLDCGAKVEFAAAHGDSQKKEDLFYNAIALSKSYLVDLTRLMLEYGANPNVHKENNYPCVSLPSSRGYLDLVLLLMQFGSEEVFDEEAIKSWDSGFSGGKSREIVAEMIKTERKLIKDNGIKKEIKLPTFSLWPQKQRIEKLEAHGWSKEKIKELLEKEKINRNIAENFFNPVMVKKKK